MADVFSPEWMPLYWRIFLDDIQHLAPDLIGGYVLLLGQQWKEGFVPSDIALLSPIAKLSVPRTRVLMKALGDRFVPHPTKPESLINEFMERVREEQRAKFESSKRKGQKGAEKRWGDRPSNSSTNGTGNSSTNSPSSSSTNADIETRDQHLASLGADAREAEQASRAARSPAWEFCVWFLTAAIAADAIDAQWKWREITWVRDNVESAESMLAEHGEAECRVRSERLFVACAARKIRRPCNLDALFHCWRYTELLPPNEAQSAPSGKAISAQTSDYLARLEAQENSRKGAA